MSTPPATALGLLPPREGDAELGHDPDLAAWDLGLSALRDTANLGIRAVNAVGADLPELPGGSLEELLVLPLSGDWAAIRQNAAACHQVEDALVTWSHRVGALGLHAATLWHGAAGSSYAVRVEALALSGRAVALLVGRGARLLDEVADGCEQLAVRVEHLVADLLETLARLVRRILTRVAGPLGWGVFAVDVATSGLDAVTDVVDDARRVVESIDTLTALHHQVADWARVQAARLEPIAAIPDLVSVTA